MYAYIQDDDNPSNFPLHASLLSHDAFVCHAFISVRGSSMSAADNSIPGSYRRLSSVTCCPLLLRFFGIYPLCNLRSPHLHSNAPLTHAMSLLSLFFLLLVHLPLFNSQPPPLFPIVSSVSGYAQISSVGISVQIGVSASLRFSITIPAVLASDLDKSDFSFRTRISSDDFPRYRQLKDEYEGGLNVPFLELMGANLKANVTIDDLEERRDDVKNYQLLAFWAREVLRNATVKDVRIEGEIMATGTGFIPETFFPFIKIAQLEVEEDRKFTVVGEDLMGVAAATDGGEKVGGMGATKLNVTVVE